MKEYLVLFRANDLSIECGFILKATSHRDVMRSELFADLVANYCREYIASILVVEKYTMEWQEFEL